MKTLFVISFLLLGCGIRGNAQPKSAPSADYKESKTESTMIITEDDYSCLLNIHCLKDTGILAEKGWNIRFENMNKLGPYTISGRNGFRKTLEASYDENGELTDARLTRINVVLPRAIRAFLDNELSGWTVTSNEMVVEDFNTEKTEYKVNLKKGTARQSIYFNHLGKPIGFREIVLQESDYSCLQNIHCLESTELLQEKGWNIRFENIGETGPYALTGKNGLRKTLNARYDKKGELIEASLIRVNVVLPAAVRESIVAEFPDWTMTSNEMAVADFDAAKTEYKVNLKKGSERQTVWFDEEGSRIEGFTIK